MSLILRFLFSSALVFGLSFLSLSTYANQKSEKDCVNSLLHGNTKALGSIQSYIKHANSRSEDPNLGKASRFLSLNEEIELSKTRKPEFGPKLMQDYLPQGVGFIDHKLHSADEDGLVKMRHAGSVLPLRATMDWNGYVGDTNVYLTSTALTDNTQSSQKKYLVGKSTKALILWGHGGGTPTATGASAQDLADFFSAKGVAVLAPDMPGHGEGSRAPFTSAEEVFDYLMAMLDKYVHPDVPVYFAGHSMGGLYSLILSKLSYKEKYKKRIRGIMALAPVADVAPGQSYAEKLKTEEQVSIERMKRFDEMSPGDYEFITNTVRNGKTAPTAMWHVNMMSRYNDFSIPEDKGGNLVKTLSLLAKYDGLTYVGYEKDFEEYFSQMTNMDHVIIDVRDEPKSPNTKVGHGLFKAYLPGTIQKEAYSRMKWFMEEDLNINLDDTPGLSPKEGMEQFQALLDRFLKIWANNLAFREFTANHDLILVDDEPVIELVKKKVNAIVKYEAQVNKLMKAAKKDKKSKEEIEKMISSIPLPLSFSSAQQMREEKPGLFNLLKLTHIPEDATPEVQNVVKKRLQSEKEGGKLNSQVTAIKSKYIKSVAEFEQILRDLNTLLRESSSPAFNAALKASEEKLNKLFEIHEQLNKAQSAYYLELDEKGEWNASTLYNPPAHIIEIEKAYSVAYEDYKKELEVVRVLQKREAVNGKLVVESSLNKTKKIMELSQQIWPDQSGVPFKGSLLERLREEQKELERLDIQMENQRSLKYQYLLRYAELVPGYYKVRQMSLKGVLNLPIEEAAKYTKEIGKALSYFEDLWLHRPPVENYDVQSFGEIRQSKFWRARRLLLLYRMKVSNWKKGR